MGFSERVAGLPPFSQAVISLWFRVPAGTVSSAVAAYEAWESGESGAGDLSRGIIPLLTFGHRGTYDFYHGLEEGHTFPPLGPSVIGLSCQRVSLGDTTNPVCFVHLQYDRGGNPNTSEPNISDWFDYFQVGDKIPPTINQWPDLTGIPHGFIEVTPDVWHHLLISFDLTGPCGRQAENDWTTCPFYWAFDGVNYNAEYLWPFTAAAWEETGPDNGIVSVWGAAMASNPAYPLFDSSDIPADNFGIPGCSDDSAFIYNVIIAEMQIYTGVTMDTGANIDKFIVDGHPVSKSFAAAFLGKEPEIYFRTQADWISGNNRGTAGDFTPTGTIAAYTPGP